MKRSSCLLASKHADRNRSALPIDRSQREWLSGPALFVGTSCIICLVYLMLGPALANGQQGPSISIGQPTETIEVISTESSSSSRGGGTASANVARTPVERPTVVKETSVKSNATIRGLLEIQNKIQKAAAKNIPATVAITDGIGFGSGVIVSKTGIVMTAGHVMTTGGQNWEVIFPSGKRAACRPLGKNLDVDAGLVQITEAGDWPIAEVSKRIPQRGDWVVSLGHSGGFELGRNPPIRSGKFIAVRQGQIVSDAVLIGGDSGGPLFDLDGKLIGIHSSIGENVAENRHVPVQTFKKHWKRMLNGETWGALPNLDDPSQALRKTRRGRLGVTMDRSAPNALIKSVEADSPAGQLGVQVGDVVIELDGTMISNSGQLIDLIKKKRATDKCSLLVLRNGGYFRYEITLTAERN